MTFRLALFGASPDTPNMGVSALFASAVASISSYIDSVEFVVFDNGLGRRDSILKTAEGRDIKLIYFGARGGRRYYRPENLATMLLASHCGRLGGIFNEGICLIDSCAAILDVSGGDSFSDIYGRWRFNNVYRPKAIAINRRKPLILLPQTYGPYKDPEVLALAASAVRLSSMAWARDQDSYEILKALLGESFNPAIHRCGVDMAFGLPSNPATQILSPTLKTWLENKSSDTPLIGFNVSGLIYNNPESATRKYGFRADYRQVVVGFLRKILTDTNARVILISHVMDQPGHYESDLGACLDVLGQLGEQYAARVEVAPATLNQSQVKWLIAEMDWFCGTRMHSAIAGLSSGVPTASISYSDKTKGVFGTCGQSRCVIDPRQLDTDNVIDQLTKTYSCRTEILLALANQKLNVISKANEQASEIAKFIIANANIHQTLNPVLPP